MMRLRWSFLTFLMKVKMKMMSKITHPTLVHPRGVAGMFTSMQQASPADGSNPPANTFRFFEQRRMHIQKVINFVVIGTLPIALVDCSAFVHTSFASTCLCHHQHFKTTCSCKTLWLHLATMKKTEHPSTFLTSVMLHIRERLLTSR